MAMTEQQVKLVIAAQGGDVKSFEELYSIYHEKVYALASMTLRNQNDAEDILQEAFITAWRKLDTLDNPPAFSVWIQIIAKNLCNMQLRRKGQPVLLDAEQDIEDFDTEDSEELLPAVYAERADLKERLGRIIDGLSDVQRQAIVLYYFNGLSVEEIADVMQCNVNTVKSRLFQARKAIRSEIEEAERKSGEKFYGVAGVPMLVFGQLVAADLQARTISLSAATAILDAITGSLATSIGAAGAGAGVAGAGVAGVGVAGVGVGVGAAGGGAAVGAGAAVAAGGGAAAGAGALGVGAPGASVSTTNAGTGASTTNAGTGASTSGAVIQKTGQLSLAAKIAAGIASVATIGALVMLAVIIISNNSLSLPPIKLPSITGLNPGMNTPTTNETPAAENNTNNKPSEATGDTGTNSITSEPSTSDNFVDPFNTMIGYWVADDNSYIGFINTPAGHVIEYGLFETEYGFRGSVIDVNPLDSYGHGLNEVAYLIHCPAIPPNELNNGRPEGLETFWLDFYYWSTDGKVRIKIDGLDTADWRTYFYRGTTVEEAYNNR
ncbi:MAG: sigma-70 family RNA polymerase sigma factor [Coriobacteriales bacterium]|jgi:RNA polymerase sigma factor (sigma-70 family)|nr:sigma-70 family RNA polymerase sigma factor [Coriobacteriales bacterium]